MFNKELTWFGEGALWMLLVALSAWPAMLLAGSIDLQVGYLESLALTGVARVLPGVWAVTK